jgi:hypothetical protein
LAKAQRGHFFHAGVNPKKVLMEFKISPDAIVPIGASSSIALRDCSCRRHVHHVSRR